MSGVQRIAIVVVLASIGIHPLNLRVNAAFANQGQTAPAGTISGVVTNHAGAPVRMARVTLSARELGSNRSALTDQQGRFVFVALPAGRYQLTAHKQGFVRTGYGARAPGRPGISIPLQAGQQLDRINITLARGGTITGVILDSDGEPVLGVAVRAQRLVMQDGERRLQPAGADLTDDRGAYRIYQLPPGKYFISAVSQRLESDATDGDRPAAVDATAAGFAPVFYPGTSTITDALQVPLGVAEERWGVDFRLQPVSTARVGGSVRGPSQSSTCLDVQVALVPMAMSAEAVAADVSVAQVEGGRFTFVDVGPGSYRVSTRCVVQARTATQPGQIFWAAQDISVAGKDAVDLELSLRRGVTVSGSLTAEGASRADWSRARIVLVPRDAEFVEIGREPFVARIDAGGRFTIAGVPPGVYEVDASLPVSDTAPGRGSVTSHWTLSSALIGEREALDFFLRIRPDEHVQDAALTFSSRRQELSGTLVDLKGWPAAEYTVIVFPTDARYWLADSRRIASTRPGNDGRFTFSGLPPGTYLLAALSDVTPDELYDPDFLRHLVPASVPIALAPGGATVQNLRVGR